MFRRENSGVALLVIAALIPAVLWAVMEPLGERFGSLFASLAGGGQVAGLVGMALFSLNFVLSARLSFLEPFFNGVNRMSVVRHQTGAWSFILLIAHPLFLALSYATISIQSAAMFLWDFSDPILTFGKLALFLLMVLLGITFYAHWKYENWKLSHQWLGLPFFLGGIH